MIKVKLYSDNDFLTEVLGYALGKEKPAYAYNDELFNTIMENWDDSIPFSDNDSIDLLQNAFGVVKSRDDRYSIEWEDGSISCITTAPTIMKYALVLIYQSKLGLYTSYNPINIPNVASYLNNLPYDILIAVKSSDIGCNIGLSLGQDNFIVENYLPTNDEVTVHFSHRNNGMDIEVGDNTGRTRGLFLGKHGRYYISDNDFCRNMQFFWREHLEEICAYITKHYTRRNKFFDVRREYNSFEFFKTFNMGEFFIGLTYVVELDELNISLNDGIMTKEEYDCFVKKLENSQSYAEYKFYQDEFKVINNLLYEPKELHERKPVVMCITERLDGTYYIEGGLTVKYPNFLELIESALGYRKTDSGSDDSFQRKVMLIVDVNELLDSVEDLSKAVLGFELTMTSLEIFDKEDGLLNFRDILFIALESGKVELSKEFY